VLGGMIEVAADVGAQIVAEDLGTVPDFVRGSLGKLKIPGYKVMCWEKDGDVFRDPTKWPALSLGTSGTHDTDALATWWESMRFDERRHALQEIPALRGIAALRDVDRFTPQVHDALLDALYGSASDLVLLPIQDVFGTRDRVNKPGVVGSENWSYRLPEAIEDLRQKPEISQRMKVAKELVKKHGR